MAMSGMAGMSGAMTGSGGATATTATCTSGNNGAPRTGLDVNNTPNMLMAGPGTGMNMNGADASAAAGPVGRHASADTDWKMRAEVLTYSRARGLFAGLELHGAVIKQDKDSTREFYGRMVPFKTSLKGEIEAPKSAYPFLSTLAKWAQQAAK